MTKRVFAINANPNFSDCVKVALLCAINANYIAESQYASVFSNRGEDFQNVLALNKAAKIRAREMYKETLENLSRYIAAELAK
jgi:hypothetical protein